MNTEFPNISTQFCAQCLSTFQAHRALLLWGYHWAGTCNTLLTEHSELCVGAEVASLSLLVGQALSRPYSEHDTRLLGNFSNTPGDSSSKSNNHNIHSSSPPHQFKVNSQNLLMPVKGHSQCLACVGVVWVLCQGLQAQRHKPSQPHKTWT